MGRYLSVTALAAIGVVCAGVQLSSSVALAQSSQGSTDGKHIMIRSTVPGSDAVAEPSPNTPVPAWSQDSYKTYLDMKAKAHGGTVYTRATYAEMPDWSGLWTHAGGINFDWPQSKGVPFSEKGLMDFLAQCKTFPCGPMTAHLTPKYALQFRQKLTAVAHGFEWDQLTDCLPAGFPRDVIDPFDREFTVTPPQTWITASTQSEVRHIYTDGRGHISPDESFPMWEGDSIGFWDGDTLVIHTLYMRSEELQRVQPSISNEASTVERIRRVDPNTIEDAITLWDPLALEQPWQGTHSFKRNTSLNARMDMWSCAENNNVIQTAHGGSTFLLPGETIMVKKSYREPANIQNEALNKAIAYGAELMKQEGAAKANTESK